MRSQALKTIPKKGVPTKTSLKSISPNKNKKKSPPPKKVQRLIKQSISKISKAAISKNINVDQKDDNDSENVSTSSVQACSSKTATSRYHASSKKSKSDKEQNVTPNTSQGTTAKKVPCKKVGPQSSKAENKSKSANSKDSQKKDVKYKRNCDVIKPSSKFSKAKTIVKKGTLSTQKKIPSLKKSNKALPENNLEIKSCIENFNTTDNKNKLVNDSTLKDTSPETGKDRMDANKFNESVEKHLCSPTDSDTSIKSPSKEIIRSDNERPLKFFTTTRSPRTVDIDGKCCKIGKGSLSVTDRSVSMKTLESNNESTNDITKDLISPGPEIDVYTFTDKVDSPKSILSGFRSPGNKNVGRVRPIARVKGTVIDKNKIDTERKKYSPHRPIEEVVKQLKANKKSEELKCKQNIVADDTSSNGTDSTPIKSDEEDKPKSIVSKSYKMVARKTSIPGKPFIPIKVLEQEPISNNKGKSSSNISNPRKVAQKSKKKVQISDEEIDTSTFSLNTKSNTNSYSSSDESVSESNDDTKESGDSDKPKIKNKKYKRITDSARKKTSRELQELSKDSLVDLKEESMLLGKDKPSKRRLKLLSMWSGPKKHRMASLNAIAKVHCLYENESRTHLELGLMKTVDRPSVSGCAKPIQKKKESKMKDNCKSESNSESEYERKDKSAFESSEDDTPAPSTRTLRGEPGIRSAGKYWDPKSSTSSSEDSEQDSNKKIIIHEKKKTPTKFAAIKSDSEKPPAKMKKTSGVPVKKKRNRNEVVMDFKDMVVQKRMASLNASAILTATYEKRSPKSSKDDTTSDSCSDESFSHKSKNVISSGVKSETKLEEPKLEIDDATAADRKQKVEVIVNQDTDVTITGVYSHHEGFCTVSGLQYRISSTSHTQTTATANCEKEGCIREDGNARYTPLTALSSMQPPATEQAHGHSHPVAELGGLNRRAGCSSAFSAPSPAAHHDPGKTTSPDLYKTMAAPITPFGYYQPAGPLIKETGGGADAERALARYHPAPHYHAPHAPVLQQYGPPYYPELCYSGRYYRPPGSYHMPPPPQPESQMVGVANDPYPPPQYYGGPPCYQHSPQRVPYIEYRGCPCPMNAYPKNVLIGPVTGKAPTGGGPVDVPSSIAQPGGAFRTKVRAACVLDAGADSIGSGKDPPASADAPRPGTSPPRQLYDARSRLRLASDSSSPAEALGPPSPARGSAGACPPQPPSMAPRRARLGKAMARRSLAGDDTALLLNTPQPPSAHQSDADDDVLAISPPTCVPIDLSSSDETERRSTPLLDVKKENEGPTYTSPRKPDTLALREHNSAALHIESAITEETTKAVKRRYSKPKLEIELRDAVLEDSCKTNGIGEHVKLQKRRKMVPEQSKLSRSDIVNSLKKDSPKSKKIPKTQTTDTKCTKRKSNTKLDIPPLKKIHLDSNLSPIQSLQDKEQTISKPKTKSALVLDNLLRKNSVDRPDAKSFNGDDNINPAELFLTPNETTGNNTVKKNINDIIATDDVDSIRLKATTVTQLIAKKLTVPKNSSKCENIERNDSKIITHTLKSIKSVLNPTVKNVLDIDEKSNIVPEVTLETKSKGGNTLQVDKCKDNQTINTNNLQKRKKLNAISDKLMSEAISDKSQTVSSDENNMVIRTKVVNKAEPKSLLNVTLKLPEDKLTSNLSAIDSTSENSTLVVINDSPPSGAKTSLLLKAPEKIIAEKITKRPKLSIEKAEGKEKTNEKVGKLLVSKKLAIKADEAMLLVEEACNTLVPKSAGKRMKRRRSGPKKPRKMPTLLLPPDADYLRTPRWSNGWDWEGENFVSKVYVNNDSRMDRLARCWSRMVHTSGDRVARGDCVLLRASQARAQPFVARVAHLWENPDDGEMMVSLVWYYRPEHTERGRQAEDAPDEVFASRHRDANSVATIEDKCHVLTFNEYCRYRKRLKAVEEGYIVPPSIVPPLPSTDITPAIATNDTKLPPTVSPELVLFCRKIYDYRSKKIQVPNK